SSKDIVKGYEYAEDQYVVLEQRELDQIKLKSTRAIDIEAFVDVNEVHPSRFEAVYYVGPNGEVAQKTFSLFSEVLRSSNKAGIGRIILRDREDVVLLTADDSGMIMYKLRYPEELRDIKAVPDVARPYVDENQLALAQTLVESLIMPFEKVDFTDRYTTALMDLINEKIDGKEVITITDEEKDDTPVVSTT
ncbi:MAG: Ku protein, partial [Bacteroidota bacterium]